MRKAVLLSGILLLLVAAAPSASGMIIEGHSPITLLVTDPNGHEFGCTASSCSPTLNFVNTLPLSECTTKYDTMNSCTYQFPSSYDEVATITIPNPAPGPWTVTYFGTGAPGASFTITIQNCPTNNGGNNQYDGIGGDCQSSCNSGNTYMPARGERTCSTSSSGSELVIPGTLTSCAFTSQGCPIDFNVNTDGTLTLAPPPTQGVPQFPAGIFLMIPALLACLLVLRAFRKGRALVIST